MGQTLCCFRPSNQPKNASTNPKKAKSLSDDRFFEVESTIMTLEDYLIHSPALNPQCTRAGEISVLKQPNNRVYPSSPDFGNAHFHTPRLSFSLGKKEKIDEFGEEDEKEVSTKSIMSRSRSGMLKKKVTFKLPEEDDMVVFYSPKETFDSISDS